MAASRINPKIGSWIGPITSIRSGDTGDPLSEPEVIFDDTVFTASYVTGTDGVRRIKIEVDAASTPNFLDITARSLVLGVGYSGQTNLDVTGSTLLRGPASFTAPVTITGAGDAVHSWPVATGSATSRKKEEFWTAPIQTTDATPTTVFSYAIPAHSTVYLDVALIGFKSDESELVHIRGDVSIRRGSGSPTAVNSSSIGTGSGADEITVGGIAPDFSGNNFLLKITGKAATTINWTAHVTALTYKP